MKKLIIALCTITLLGGCGNNIEKKANEKLQIAREYIQQGKYSEAKITIDSIKILYPKAFEARREGLKIVQQAELKEQQHSLIYLDSILQAKQGQFEQIKHKFTFEKDAKYQSIGNYFWPTQTVEKNLHRSYLRFQVDEHGTMIMTSIFCGKSNIHHSHVKVSASDGSFAETPVSKDIYETTDLGEKIEKADYKLGEDGNVIGFIYLNRQKNISVSLLGDRNYSFRMKSSDKTALTNIYELSQILSSIEQIKKEIKEANLKIEFITRKMKDNAEKEATSK